MELYKCVCVCVCVCHVQLVFPVAARPVLRNLQILYHM
jgi:hypothetical protein